LECTFLAVDHGCAVVLRLPSGGTVLYDAGKFAAPESGTQSIAGALWAMGVRHLDAVVISHPDTDHYNALPGLLERFSVGVIYVSPIMFDRQGPALAALRSAIDRAGVPVRTVRAGDILQGGKGCVIEVLHPVRRGVVGGDNANSVVLAVEYLGRRILLPGDLERPGLAYLLAEEPWPCDVLLAPHHGSTGSDPPGLAQWSRPRWVVISGGRPLDLRQTLQAYRSIGAQIVHTGHLGAVRAVVDGSPELRLEALCSKSPAGDGGWERTANGAK
jgi:competence protein ComEC